MQIIKLKYRGIKEQFKKIEEEFNELKEQVLANNKIEMVKESWDVIQAVFGLLFILLNRSELIKSYKEHVSKLEGRINTKQIEIDEYFTFNNNERG